MVILNILGKIKRLTISEKLGLSLNNLPDDWRASIVEDMQEEIYQHEYKVCLLYTSRCV